MDECIFCKIARKEIKSEMFMEEDNFICIFDVHPKARGHVLVMPKKHYVTLLDIPSKLGNEMLDFCKKVAGKLLDEKYGDGFNVLMNNLEPAGQVVKHAHIHIIPRKDSDRLRMIS